MKKFLIRLVTFVLNPLDFTPNGLLTYVNGPNWSGNVPTSASLVTDTSGAVTANTDLVTVTSQALTTAGAATAIITLTNSKIVAGVTVRANVVAYSGTLGTNGIPVVTIGSINTTNHTCVIEMTNAGANAFAGTLTVLVEVVTNNANI